MATDPTVPHDLDPVHGELARVAEAGAGLDLDKLREGLIAHLAAELGDSYDCTRVWSAWLYGTMTEDDFKPVSDRVDEIADEIINSFLSTGQAARARVKTLEAQLATCQQSLKDQAEARLDPSLPLLTPDVVAALREASEADYALAENREERVQAHGLSLLCDWQDQRRVALLPEKDQER